jgi:serine/threonine-protein kinase HipA
VTSLANVRLWGSQIGAVLLEDDERTATFQYADDFVRSGIEVAPIMMPLSSRPYRFPGLGQEAFRGLPGMLADSLPDRFGQALINADLATRGLTAENLDAVGRLCYVGQRGMGALEFEPARGPDADRDELVRVDDLTELAAAVLSHYEDLQTYFKGQEKRQALEQILRVGSSAGGARPKALIAFNQKTGEMRSGQLVAKPGFEHWIIKFDGVSDSSRDFGETAGYGAVEFVYAKLAAKAGIEMSQVRLLEEGERRHFMTRRFDRPGPADKLHMQSLAALMHLDFNQVGAHSYEQAFQTIRTLGLPMQATEQQFRRMAFNIVARNQDDHVKNIAFLMDRAGNWSLSPAFDVTYAFNDDPSRNTYRHQMSINGKRDDFTRQDFRTIGRRASIQRNRVDEMVDQVIDAVSQWPAEAKAAGIESDRVARIAAYHRLDVPN